MSNPLDVFHANKGSRGVYRDYKDPNDLNLLNNLRLSAKWYDYVSWLTPIWGTVGTGIGNGIQNKY